MVTVPVPFVLDHVPPVVVLANVIVLPAQTANPVALVIAAGVGLAVAVTVLEQPFVAIPVTV